MSSLLKKESLSAFVFLLFCAAILAFGLRGLPGNPTGAELNDPKWKEEGPFELSPERGRFALLYSVVEDGSLNFSISIARFALPDLSISPSGRYVSMFAPGVSFLVVPGYVLGKYFGASQVGAFAIIALAALINLLLIRAIAIRLGASRWAASLGAFAFLFATPAFSYAGTLYQHHISVLILLFSIYALMRWKNYWSLALVWFLYALSVVVDNPNLLLMFPVALYALARIVLVKRDEEGASVRVRIFGVLTIIAAVIPLAFFLWFNQASHGNAWKFPGTLESVAAINDKGLPLTGQGEKMELSVLPKEGNERMAVSFFKTRNLLNGFYIHLLSPDRGMIWYAPVALLGLLGLSVIYKKHASRIGLIAAIIGLDVLVYSMWGDPSGGWAFGSRYLIPAYAMLGLGLAMAFNEWGKKHVFLAIFLLTFGYSAWVNTLGAVTTNANPPKIEILALEKITGREEKYTYERNWQYLTAEGSKSFVFKSFLKDKMSAERYFEMVFGAVMIGVFVLTYLSASSIKPLNDMDKENL